MKAINAVENLRMRIVNNEVVIYDAIHASATMLRENNTFGFSFIDYNVDLLRFLGNYQKEKHRIMNSNTLFPPKNSMDCIYCSAMPWINFSSHKEPVSGQKESVPKLAFGKYFSKESSLLMNVSIAVNHALVDGYHIGLFFDAFQQNLNSISKSK